MSPDLSPSCFDWRISGFPCSSLLVPVSVDLIHGGPLTGCLPQKVHSRSSVQGKLSGFPCLGGSWYWWAEHMLLSCASAWPRGFGGCSPTSPVSTGAAAGTHREICEYPFPLFVDLDNLYPEITLLVFRISQRFSWTGFLELLAIILFPAELTLCTLGGQGARSQPVYNTFLISISVFPRSEHLHWETNKIQTNETEIKNIFCLLPTPKHLTETAELALQPIAIRQVVGGRAGLGARH